MRRDLGVAVALFVSIAVGSARADAVRMADFCGTSVAVQHESAIGDVPGHWSLTEQGFRNEYMPDSGFGNGVFSVLLSAPAAIAFDLDSVACVPCTRMEGREHTPKGCVGHWNAYQCRPGIRGRRVFFMASQELPGSGFDPGWVVSKRAPRFQVASRSSRHIHFSEWITTRDVVPGKRLACAAWFEGPYPPLKGYNEVRGDTTDLPDYVIRDRAIYLVGSNDEPEYLLRSSESIDMWDGTFELAFLPQDHSELEDFRFSYIYPVPGGFWLRVNANRDFEGAGADEGVLLLEFVHGRQRVLAAASNIRMY